jgi:hypothetical protein
VAKASHASGQRFDDAEDVRGPWPHILVVSALEHTGFHREPSSRVLPQRRGPLVEADDWFQRVELTRVQTKEILQPFDLLTRSVDA